MRGIMMIEPLYHQVIAGNKTQTRRSGGLDVINENPDNWEITGQTGEDNHLEEVDFCDYRNTQKNVYCKPRYKVNEIVFIKEPYRIPFVGAFWYRYNIFPNDKANIYDWKNKMFMPAEAARAFIQITGIRCERLLDISDADCIAEGIEASGFGNGYYINYLMDCTYGYDYLDNTPQQSFISLYKYANKMAKVGSLPPHGQLPAELLTPSENIWVWVYEFKYLKDYKYGK